MIFDMLQRSSSLEDPSVPLTDYEAMQDLFPSMMGAHVSPETAKCLSAVYACIHVLSSTVAQLPLHVLRSRNGKVEKATDHPAFYLLHDEPNPWQSSYDWREIVQADVCGWGNGLTELKRSPRGELRELVRHAASHSSLEKHGSRTVYASFDPDADAETGRAIPPEDMVHIRAIGSNARWGTSPIRQHAETIGLGLAAQRYGLTFFGQGGRPSALVTHKGTALNKDSWTRLKDAWKSAAAALKREENKTLLLPADLEYQRITIPPEEAQFLESRKLTRSEIAGIYNVPSHMINDLEKATFSNITHQAIGFVRHTTMPIVIKWEQELNRKIFTRAERAAGYYVKFNLAGLLRGTPEERAKFYHYGITDGWMNRNEARAFEDLEEVDGLSEFLVSVNASKPDDLNHNWDKDKKDEQ